ncbi:hypothetical protein RRG08_062665, partial [Elysia crispata]
RRLRRSAELEMLHPTQSPTSAPVRPELAELAVCTQPENLITAGALYKDELLLDL